MRRHAEGVGDHVLHLGRVLGRDMQRDLVGLAGERERDLALEIEMVLPADDEPPGDPPRRGGERRLRLAPAQR